MNRVPSFLPHRHLLAAVACAIATTAIPAAAQWRPTTNIEIIAMSGPGGANDTIARAVQRGMQHEKLVDKPVTVVSKVGGGGLLAWNYLNQHAGDGAYISISPINLLTEYIIGASPITYSDVTPIAQLFDEHVAFSVREDSSIESAKDILARIKADPASVSFAIAASLGGGNHIATALAMKAAGVDIRKLKFVVFNSGGRSLTAVMGGHVDVAVTPAASAARQAKNGRVRVLAVTAPVRLGGLLAQVPTWREFGVDAVFASPRGVIGPKGMTPAQIAFWDDALEKVVQTGDWKEQAAKYYWSPHFLKSAASAKFLKTEYVRYREVLVELGLARPGSKH